MQLLALFSLVALLGSSSTLAAPTTPNAVPVTKRWYDSNGCALDPTSSPDTQKALSSTPLTTLFNLGPYSPYLGQISPICRDPPAGFKVDQVQVYSRHGARNPTAKALKRIVTTLGKVVNRTSTDQTLSFLQNYTYGDVQADQLTDFGRRELWLMGKAFREAYPNLVKDHFTRAGSDERVVESGQFFLQGLEGQEYSLKANKSAVDVIISEADGQNNTLSISTCTTDENLPNSYGDVAEANWLKVFAKPIAARINNALSPPANISGADITNLISLCSFDSLKGQEWVKSPWCDVFTEQEFQGNEYYYDLSKFYNHAWGSPYARASGAGLANEIIARLTGTPVLLGSGTNSTLDTNNVTFPYNKLFYADFSHDNNLATLLPALGLEWESDLPSQPQVDKIPAHKFVVSSLVPFAGRYVFERLVDASGKKYVRIIVNEAVIRLTYAGCGEMGVTQGICELGAFVAAQSFLRQAPSVWDEICYAPPINKTVSL